jgi:CubicO group peptidase (beta-lactamase class C family)
MKTINCYSLFISLLITSILTAQPISKADTELFGKVDKLLADNYKANETGATALIARKGAIIYKKAFGMANLELNRANLACRMILKNLSLTIPLMDIPLLLTNY